MENETAWLDIRLQVPSHPNPLAVLRKEIKIGRYEIKIMEVEDRRCSYCSFNTRGSICSANLSGPEQAFGKEIERAMLASRNAWRHDSPPCSSIPTSMLNGKIFFQIGGPEQASL